MIKKSVISFIITNCKLTTDSGRVGRELMSKGRLTFCTCDKKNKCPAFDSTMSMALKFTELCLYALGLGYNMSLSYFGLDENSQKLMISIHGYYYDQESGLYILGEYAKNLLRDSKFTSPAIPACVFDCISMPEMN